jgi:hypothetical protein
MAEGRIVGEVAGEELTEQAILRLAVGVTPTRTEVAA